MYAEKTKNQKLKEFLIVIVFVTTFLTLSSIIIISYNSKQVHETSIMNDEYQASLQIPGYELDTPFDLETYEYNVKVDMDEVQVICNFSEDIKGCNEKIDMNNKDSYDHIIEISENGVTQKYTIHFKKEITPKDEKIRITSIEGIPDKWTNEDVKLTINVESKEQEGILYSFDGGKKWQKENEYIVSSNKELKIIVKDKNNKKSDAKKVIINKIDKDKPKVELMIESKSKDKVVIKAIAGDKSSEIDKYKFNDEPYSIANIFTVNKEGTYKVVVKDKAGNISDESSIKLQKNDFVDNSNKEFNYKIKLQKNGSDFDSTTLTCKSLSKTCKMTLPKIARNGGISLGWSKSKDSETADYKPGQIIEINDDITLYAVTYENLVATLNRNGATSIASQFRSCKIYNTESKCKVTLPTITRSSGIVLGWDDDRNSQTASFKQNETITLKKNTTLYAITYKELMATFNKNNATSISNTNIKCNLYNGDKTCIVKTPTINREGWSGIGWHIKKNSKTITVAPNSSLKISNNITYYAITGKTVTATFNKNGADSISSPKASCTMYNSETSCNVNTPMITRNGGNVIGWNTNDGANKALYSQKQLISLNENKKLYAITNKKLTVTFNKNGADAVGDDSDSCIIYNNETACEITTPSITRNGWNVVGWNTNSTAKTKFFDVNSTAEIIRDITYYAITYKELTATLQKGDADSISENSKSCTVYNTKKSCTVVLPLFANTGAYNLVWQSSSKECAAGENCSINENLTFKATGLHPYYTYLNTYPEKKFYKTRELNVQKVYKKGNTIFEYESGIPQKAVDDHIKFLEELYKIMPYLFNQGKVFVFTPETYLEFSAHYGLTHYSGFNFFIDLKYDKTRNEINENATIHELSHGWDGYYKYKKGKRISEQDDVRNLYNSHLSNIVEGYNEGSYNEFFAATITNYYWFILEKDLTIKNGDLFIYNSGFRYSSADKEKIIKIINKYK